MIALALCTIMNQGCRDDQATVIRGVQVVATIPPLAEFAEQIGKDRVTVSVMVPPGASPHAYEPTPGQMALLANADLYVKVGTPLEFELAWLDKLMAIHRTMQVCDASKGIDRITGIEHAHGDRQYIDPHIWLSPRNACLMVKNICDALSGLDPMHKRDYEKNATAYCARLDSLDTAITRMVTLKKKKIFIVYHDAWQYFARDYGLEQRVIESGGKEPSAKGIQHIIETARAHDIHLLFASPQFNRKYADMIARDIDGQVILVDPLAHDYIKNLVHIADLLAQYLE